MLELKDSYEKGDKALMEFFRGILPSIIVDHNFYETETKKMESEAIAELIFGSLELTRKVMDTYTQAAFFYPSESERRQIASLSREVFRGRYSKELYTEYQHWLPYITDLYLPCCDTETGDFRNLPCPGSVSDQPYITMQVMKLVQLQYRIHLDDKMKKDRIK